MLSAPVTAFCLLMNVEGGSITESQVRSQARPDGTCRIAVGDKEYLLKTMPTSPFGIL